MSVKYQVDGDIFREITEKWLSAYVKEYRIRARVFETDQAGNIIENFQLNDGRVFTRQIPVSRASSAGESKAPPSGMPRLAPQRVE